MYLFKKTWREVLKRIGRTDALILIATYCTSKVLAEVLIWWQWKNFLAKHQPQCSPWMPEEEVRGITLLAPGYTHTLQQTAALAADLHRAGHIIFFLETPPQGNIFGYEKMIEMNQHKLEQMKELREQHAVPITFVGFSYGGCCIVRLARVMRQLHSVIVDHVVTVQSPLQGSRVSFLGAFPAVHEIDPESPPVTETTRAIEELEAQGTTLKYFCALYDEIVRRKHSRPPRNGQHTRHNRWSHELIHVGHWGALQNPIARAQIVAYVLHLTKK